MGRGALASQVPFVFSSSLSSILPWTCLSQLCVGEAEDVKPEGNLDFYLWEILRTQCNTYRKLTLRV